MSGKSLGIVGLGQIGSAVARKMSSWGLRILAADPYLADDHARSLGVQRATLDSVCSESDYLMLHLPLLPETHHLIGARQFGMMKEGSILVNTARGPVVDTKALHGCSEPQAPGTRCARCVRGRASGARIAASRPSQVYFSPTTWPGIRRNRKSSCRPRRLARWRLSVPVACRVPSRILKYCIASGDSTNGSLLHACAGNSSAWQDEPLPVGLSGRSVPLPRTPPGGD